MHLLRELTEARGVPGYEKEVRAIVKRELENIHSQILTDRMGSIFGEKKGNALRPRILLAGHLDEVGFMVTEITKGGYLRFAPLGGWWNQVLLSQRVTILTDKKEFTGVIGSKPPHILSKKEYSRVYPLKEMFIDVGAHSDEQVREWGICIGDPIIPICPFEILPDGDTILAKALDNRVGCYLAIEILKQLKEQIHPNTVIAGATVQEELGLRGAMTSPYVIEPDLSFALDVGIAEDSPGNDNNNKAKLRKGPLITFLDATMIPNTGLRNFIINIAEEKKITYQVDTMLGGGTDAGKFHLYKQGVPSIVVGVPARYIHSHVSMVSKKDIQNAVRLLVEVIKKLDEQRFESMIHF